MWNVQDVGCLQCGMLGIWDIWDVAYLGCWMFRVLNVWDVGCLRCGRCGMFTGMLNFDLQNV